MVIWTKHFTSFVAYSQIPVITTITTPPGGCIADYSMSSPASVTGTAGLSVTIPVAVSSTGTCTNPATINAAVPNGWSAASATTPAFIKGQSHTVNIIVQIPEGAASGTVVFSSTINGKTISSSTLVNVQPAAASTPVTPTPAPATPGAVPTSTEAGVTGATTAGGGITGLITANPTVMGGIVIAIIIVAYIALRMLRKRKNDAKFKTFMPKSGRKM